MADQSRTLSLILSAKDEASASINKLNGALSSVKTILATIGIGWGLKELISNGEQNIAIQRQLGVVLAATGHSAGLSAEQINNLSTKLAQMAGLNDSVTVMASNILLRFTNIKNEAFEPTLEASIKLAQSWNNGLIPSAEGVSQAAELLGKVLNNPVASITLLRRSGVQLGEDQEKQIEKFMKVGDVAKAQGVILEALSSSFGKLSKDSLTPLEQLRAKLREVEDKISAGLMPVVNQLSLRIIDLLNVIVPWVQQNWETIKTVGEIAVAMGGTIIACVKLTAGVKALTAAFFVLTAHPIIAFLSIMAGWVVYVTEKYGGLQNVFPALLLGFQALGEIGVAGLKLLGNSVITFINYVLEVGNKVYNFFSGLLKKVGVDIGEADMKIDFKFDLAANKTNLDNIAKQLQAFEDKKTETTKAGAEMTEKYLAQPYTKFANTAEKTADEVAKLQEKFNNLGDKIKSTFEGAVDAIAQTAEKIKDIKESINNLLVENASKELEGRQSYAEAYVTQEQKVAEMQQQVIDKRLELEEKVKNFQNKTEVTTSDLNTYNAEVVKLNQEIALLQQQADRERTVFEQRKTIEIAYQNEVNEVRRRNAETEFERTLEDLSYKQTAYQQEFEAKYLTLQGELDLETKKYQVLEELQKNIVNYTIKSLGEQELATVESINRQIEYYNRLAEAVQKSKSGETSLSIKASAASKNAASGGVTVQVSNNNIYGTGGLKELADTISKTMGNRLGLSSKIAN